MRTVLLRQPCCWALAVQAQSDKIVGRWTGDDMGEPITLVFDEEGFANHPVGYRCSWQGEYGCGRLSGYIWPMVSFRRPV